MSILNTALGALFDALLWPFAGVHPMVGLTVVSTACAVLMLVGYRATSDQPAIERVKRQIAAGLFEIRLFNDDLAAILRAQRSILRHNLTYLRLNLVPMLFMIVPFVLVVAQLQFRYGYEGLQPGDSTTVTVTLAEEAAAGRPDVRLEAPAGLRVDTPPVWIRSLRQAAWRLVAERPGSYELTVALGDRSFTKRVVVSDRIVRRAPQRLRAGFLNELVYPAEPPLPADAPVEAIALDYPERSVGLGGFETHWLVVFFLLTIVIAFALKGRFGVTI